MYGIIHEICTPQPGSVVFKPGPSTNSSKLTGKTMCRDSSCSGVRKYSNRARRNTEQQRGTHNDKQKTLSKKRQANYGISTTNITTRKVQISRQPIDYVSLNDGYDEEEQPQPRKNGAKSLIDPEVHRLHQEYQHIE